MQFFGKKLMFDFEESPTKKLKYQQV